MSTYVLSLLPVRPDLAHTATDSELEIMGRHAEHWRPYIESGQMVAFGPVDAGLDSFGLLVLEADAREEIENHAGEDPAVLAGLGRPVIGTMLGGHIRGGEAPVAGRHASARSPRGVSGRP
jgi:uncharacterized protein